MTDKEKNRFNYKDKLIYEAIENNIKAENGELTKLTLMPAGSLTYFSTSLHIYRKDAAKGVF